MSALNTFVPLISKKVMLKKHYWEEREALSICKQGNAFPYRESSTCEGAGHDTVHEPLGVPSFYTCLCVTASSWFAGCGCCVVQSTLMVQQLYLLQLQEFQPMEIWKGLKRQQKYELLGNLSVHTENHCKAALLHHLLSACCCVDSAQPHASQQSLLSVHVLGLALHQLFHATVSATGVFTPLHFALCTSFSVCPSPTALTSYSIPPYIPDSGLTLF